MLLYHGTCESRLRNILALGIRPRGRKRGNHAETIPSSPGHVYLTDTYALLYAVHTANVTGKGRPAVVEIDTDRLDTRKLNADEDALEQSQRRRDRLPADWTQVQRVLHYRRKIATGHYDWEASLGVLGTCAHRGTIPRSAITRVAIVDHRQQARLMLAAINGSVTAMNHRFASKPQKAALRWLFGEEELPEALRPIDRGEDLDPRLRWEFVWPPSEHRDGIEIIHA